MKRIVKTFFGAEAFKLVAFFASLLIICPLTALTIEPYLKLLHLYGFAVIIVDLFSERRVFKNKGRVFAFIFVISYLITFVTNKDLISFSGLSNFLYLVEALFIVYSYGSEASKANRKIAFIICTVISAANLIGIWMFYQKFYMYVEGRGYIGMFPSENRLAGLFGNPNVLGMVCLIAITMSVIEIARSEKSRLVKCYSFLLVVNSLTLLLSNSRTQIYACLAFVGVLAFMLLFRKSKGIKQTLCATVAAVVCILVGFAGVKLLQYGLSFFDYRYDYYVQNIESGSRIQSTKDLSITTGNNASGKPTLKWNSQQGAQYYEVYRAPAQDATFVKVFTTEGRTYTHISAEDGHTYYYYVLAILSDGLSIRSKVVSLQLADTSTTQGTAPTEQGIVESNKLTVARKTDASALNGRLDIWKKGLQVLEAKPLFGCGLDNVAQTLSNLGKDTLTVRGNLHNAYIEVLVTTGIVGAGCLVAYLLFMLREVIIFFKSKDNKHWVFGSVYLACIVAFMVDGLADSTLVASVYPTALAFWMIASQFACLLDNKNRKNILK